MIVWTWMEFLLVWWGGAWWRSRNYPWWWGGWWGIVHCNNYYLEVNWSKCIIIWAGWVGSCTYTSVDCGRGGDSCFWDIVAYGGGGGWPTIDGTTWNNWGNGWSGWGASCWNYNWWNACNKQWKKWGDNTTQRWAWWGGRCCPWMPWCYCDRETQCDCYGGIGWCWYCSDITWTAVWYWSWWSWWWCKRTPWECGWWSWGSSGYSWSAATTHWSWGGWWWYKTIANCWCKWWNWCKWVFIFRYPLDCWYCFTWGTITCKCGYKIHCFCSNGTLCRKP